VQEEDGKRDEKCGENGKGKFDEFLEEALDKEDKNRKAKVQESTGVEPTEAAQQPAPGATSSGMADAERKRGIEKQKEREEVQRQRIEEAIGEKRNREEDEVDEDEPQRKVFVREDEVDEDESQKKVFVGELEVNQDHEEEWEEWAKECYFDDKTGRILDTKLEKVAEDEEVAFMEKIRGMLAAHGAGAHIHEVRESG
jgi:hypothetical protein